ncbi:MAG: chemotaxis response regulator protein-glutamate methylesterase [Candidatus Bathyarchaeota archaeon]|nr:chemotaxis response regulator protein-glutamate methylesterase [Candidatus Bathyarchaeota archaeon]
MKEQIKILVVDDSLLMQKILTELLQSDPQISVIGTARDGEEALQKIPNLHPDVVTLDIEMPRMDGLTAIKKIMKTTPLPVVMISALTQRQAQLTLKALELGAVDYVPKPSGPISLNMDSVKTELITKVKTAASANIQQVKPRMMKVTEPPKAKGSDRVISIAASTGGPAAVTYILKHIPENTPPILIVQHMQKGMTRLFAEGLNQECKFKVKEAEEGDVIQEGLALIAPGGLHMQVTKNGKISLTANPPVNYVRPSADVLMTSAAKAYTSKNIGVVLTGMGVDGAKGIEAIKKKGGVTIAQDRKTCVVFGMPYAAIKTGCVDCVTSLECIPKEIMNACED